MAATEDHTPADHSTLTNVPETTYEPTDIKIRPILFTGLALVVCVVICGAIAIGLMYWGIRYRENATPASIPVARGLSQIPPEPRLQQSPRADFAQYKAEQLAKLQSYQWIDQRAGTVRIPIDAAMRMIAERGIPPRKAPPELVLSMPASGTRLTGFENGPGPAEGQPR